MNIELTPEQAVLAIILSRPSDIESVVTRLKAEYFNSELEKRCFAVVDLLFKKRASIDMVMFSKEGVSTRLIGKRDLSTVMEWVSSLPPNIPSDHYISSVMDDYIQRETSKILLTEAPTMGVLGEGSLKANLVIKKLTDLLSLSSQFERATTMSELMRKEREAFYRRKAIYESGGTSGVDTGITPVNNFTGGWQSELIIVAGRPGMGKTATALFHGIKAGVPGIYFNLEMGDTQLAQRLILMHENLPSNKLRDGALDGFDIPRMEQAIGRIESESLMVYSKPGCGVYEAIRLMKQYHREGLCKFAIIDYLQLLTIEGLKGVNREQEVANIIKELKRAQREMDIPIIVLAQLSREVEKRNGGKKPILSDLRESGEIEQSADTVIFVYRPAMYGLSDDSGAPYTNEIFYLVEKHRQGAVGKIEFRHNSTMTSFYGASEEVRPLPKPSLAPSKSFHEPERGDLYPFE